MKNYAFNLKNRRKVLIIGSFIIIIELIFFAYISYPPNILYLLRKGGETVIAQFAPNHKSRAVLYLKESVRLQNYLAQKHQKNPSDPNLGIVSQELIYQEQKAINEMDLAKKAGVNIRDQVNVLCDTLIKQYDVLQQAVSYSGATGQPELQQSLDVTKLHVFESIGW